MKKLLFLFLCLGYSSMSYGGIYKCKKDDGSINYSSIPCLIKSESLQIDTLINLKKTSKVPMNKIKLASHGLKNIRLDGFGKYSFKDLKLQLKRGDIVNKKIDFYKNKNSRHSFILVVNPENNGVILTYMIQKSFADSSDQSRAFDISPEDVSKHIRSLGLNKKPIIKKNDHRWRWKKDGFDCEVSISKRKSKKWNDFIQACIYA